MKINLQTVTVRELFQGYQNNEEEGVIGYEGKLDIRPAYQREFVYKDKQQQEVINTVRKNFPLNVMYWVKSDDGYELLDGQQRTLSICDYINDGFAIKHQYFHNLTKDEQEQILDYNLQIYICEGESKEKLDWFKIINIAGEKLTTQEMRNALYSGPWLHKAKQNFSKTGCPAFDIAKDYMSGSPIRQEYLETVLDWASRGNIEDYMATSQHKKNANELWAYFNAVINWVKTTFPKYRTEMKGLPWGKLYNDFGHTFPDVKILEEQVQRLMQDDDVTNKKGVYLYVLTGDEKYLNIRAFSQAQKRSQYEQQAGICPHCGEHFTEAEMEADHIQPWHEGGQTSNDNVQMLCKPCNRKKGGK